MSGLIWGGLINGVGQGMSAVGAQELKEQARAEERAERYAEHRELQRQRQQDRVDMFTLAQAARQGNGGNGNGNGGGSGGDGMPANFLQPGSASHEQARQEMGLSEPQMQQYLQANRSGDFSGYNKRAGDYGPNPDGTTQDETITRPGAKDAGGEQWAAEKKAILLKIARDYGQGQHRDDIAKGRETEQKIDTTQGIIDGQINAPKAAEAFAATKGDGAYGKGGVNQFTGAPDQVGRSQIGENNAQAGSASAMSQKHAAEVKKIEGEIKNGTLGGARAEEKLSTIYEKQVSAIKLLGEQPIGETPAARADRQRMLSDARAGLDQTQRLLRSQLDARGAPAGAQQTQAVQPQAQAVQPARSRYPEGTRLRGPNGSLYTVRNGRPVPEGR